MASWIIVQQWGLLSSSRHCRWKLIRQDINFPNLLDRRFSHFCRYSDKLNLIEFCPFNEIKSLAVRFLSSSVLLNEPFSATGWHLDHIVLHKCKFYCYSRTCAVPSMWLKTHIRSHSWLIPVWMDGIVTGGRYADMAWLGLAWLGCPTSTPSTPPGSCGGSDKNEFPDRDQSDSWVAWGRWMDMGLRWASGPSGTCRAYNVCRKQWYKWFDQSNRHYCSDSTRKDVIIMV